jgi:hypothetical protein
LLKNLEIVIPKIVNGVGEVTGAAVWTLDIYKAFRVVKCIRAGIV